MESMEIVVQMYIGQGAAEDLLTASGTPFGIDKCSYSS